MHVRIDEEVYTKEDVGKLGISIGDIVAFEPFAIANTKKRIYQIPAFYAR